MLFVQIYILERVKSTKMNKLKPFSAIEDHYWGNRLMKWPLLLDVNNSILQPRLAFGFDTRAGKSSYLYKNLIYNAVGAGNLGNEQCNISYCIVLTTVRLLPAVAEVFADSNMKNTAVYGEWFYEIAQL